MKALCSIIAFLSISSMICIYAQDSTYIQSYPNHWTAGLFAQNRTITLNIRPLKGKDQDAIIYEPNVASTGGAAMIFKKFGLKLAFQLGEDSKIERRAAQSKYFDLQLHSFAGKTSFDVYIQDYKGYFISNPDNVFGVWDEDKLPHRSDLRLFHLGINGTYIFNEDKFSYRAAFIYDEAQKKSAGSFLLTGALDYNHITADSSIVPPAHRLNFQGRGLFDRATLYNLAVIPGYTHTFVFWKHLYLNLGLSMNVGLRFQKFGLKARDQKNIVPSFKAIGRGSLGYNSERFFMGLGLMVDNQRARLADTETGTTTIFTQLMLGWRFPTKILKNHHSVWKWLFDVVL